MHNSVMLWGQDLLTEELIKGKDILEVGSLDVNGSWRPLAEKHGPKSYLGVDYRMGPRVDRVVEAEMLPQKLNQWFDVVLSTEMLEHALDWQGAMRGMWGVTRPGGVLMVTCRGPGFPKHDFPHDHWRFTPKVLRACFPAGVEALAMSDYQAPGVFLWARKPIVASHSAEFDLVFPLSPDPVL